MSSGLEGHQTIIDTSSKMKREILLLSQANARAMIRNYLVYQLGGMNDERRGNVIC